MAFEFEKIDLMDAFKNPPGEDYIWQFRPDTKTFLQTDSERVGEVHWYLTHDEGGDPARWEEIEGNPASVLSALQHYADKCWVDKTQLLEALMPAIRAVCFS